MPYPRRRNMLLTGGFTPSDVPQTEADALIWLYNNGGGAGWTDHTNWLINPAVGTWFGVTVAGGHVTQLDLNTNNGVGDIGAFPIADLPFLTYLSLHANNFSGDLSGWVLPASLAYLRLNINNFSGDLSGWVLPNSLIGLRLNANNFSGDLSGWVLPNSLTHLYLYDNSFTGTPNIGSNTAMHQYYYYSCGLLQANVDAVLLSVYNRRMAFVNAAPELNVGGTNLAPNGIYQAQCPPTTGKEYAFELVNDSCGDGHIKWVVTFTP